MTRTEELRDHYHGVRVAVLGASGFVGRWVAHELCRLGARRSLVVRDRKAARRVFLDHDITGDIFEVDLVRSPQAIGPLLREIQPSVTFNLVSYGVDPSERDEETAYQTNAHLVDEVCKAIAKVQAPEWKGCDMVHVGSASEYGAIGGDLSEDLIPHPTTLYGRSKLQGTQRLAHNCQSTSMEGLTARLFTVYGPGEHPGNLLPSLFETARTGLPLELTVGRQERDFTYVSDVVEGLLRLGVTQGNQGDVVNLATGVLTTVHRFAKVAAHLLGLPPEHLRFGIDPVHSQGFVHQPATLSRLRKLTGWVPSTGIAEGVCRTMELGRLRQVSNYEAHTPG